MAHQTEQVALFAEQRTVLGKQVKQLRREGVVPAVIYGRDFESIPLQFDARSLAKVLSHVGGSQLISVKIKGKKTPEMVLVREVHRDPVRHTLLHVDLYRVRMTERLTAEVPLEIVGESPVIEAREGILLQGLSTVEVECLPGDLVDAIEVDLSELTAVDQALHVRDLAIPSGIDVLTAPDEMIVRVVPLEEEEELPAVEEMEMMMPGAEEVEVITAAGEEEESGAEE
jgi:large subunit ribosomal protein L25